MTAPTVSCIVPAYNYAAYLPAALDSALAQDYPAGALEIIVVDDGSTDGTPDVIAAYADRVRSVRRPNGGLNAATQTGMELATGELLTFLDADDTWPADRTRLLVDALRAAPGAGLAYGDMTVIDLEGGTVHPSFRAQQGLAAPSGRVFDRLLQGNFISAGSLMVRASLRDAYCPIPGLVPYQDWWIASQVARTEDVVAVPGVVNRYVQHDRNMNIGHDEPRRAALIESELPFRRFLLQTAAGLADVRSLLIGLRELDAATRMVCSVQGREPRELLGLDETDRAEAIAAIAEASARLDEGAVPEALFALVAAVAHDPSYAEPRDLIAALAPHAAAQAPAPAVAV